MPDYFKQRFLQQGGPGWIWLKLPEGVYGTSDQETDTEKTLQEFQIKEGESQAQSNTRDA